MSMLKQVLIKTNTEPGLCDLPDITDSLEFLIDFNNKLKLFREVYGTDPIGYTVESKIDSLRWYAERKGYKELEK